jgi:parallel beta-helix repeat protein
MKQKILTTGLILIVLLLLSACATDEIHEFFIASNGSSSNKGTKESPFLSLVDAKDAIRQLKKDNRLTKGDVTVWLRGGIYELPVSFSLLKDDSGTEKGTITYSAYPGENVVISGGKRISFSSVYPVSSETARRITNKEAIPGILEIDLAALSISDYGTNQISGFRRPYVNSAMELFINGRPSHLARYPNAEQIRIKPEDVIDDGLKSEDDHFSGTIRFDKNKISKWSLAHNIMVNGNFRYAWANDELNVKNMDPNTGLVMFTDSHMYGISGTEIWNQYYYFNLLEEIDYPGEYYIDNQKGMLYFYPFEELKSSDTVTVSILEDALVSLKEASYIKFKDITFEAGRGIGIYMENTYSNKIENCTIRNMGGAGVCIGMGSKPSQVYRHPDAANPFYPDEKLSGAIGSLYELFYENTTFNREGGKNNGVISCKIENTGRGGISLGGGDRLTLEPAGNYVFNCEFTNCARLDYSYKSPVNIDGVGNKIQHCQFNSCPATSIYVHGNNHLIEYNVISEACNFMDDQGAIYIGRDPSEFGNIIRYNFFKNIGNFGMTMAVYYDDGACGTQLYGNVFYKAGSRTIMVGGGSYNPIFNNIFINSDLVLHLDNRLDGWASNSLAPGGIFEIRMNKVNYDKPPYSVAYPALATYFRDSPQIPKHNDIKNNLFVNIKELHNGQKEWGPIHDENIITNEDPGFEDAANLNFTLAKESEIFKTLPEFLPIPFKEIGLIK